MPRLNYDALAEAHSEYGAFRDTPFSWLLRALDEYLGDAYQRVARQGMAKLPGELVGGEGDG